MKYRIFKILFECKETCTWVLDMINTTDSLFKVIDRAELHKKSYLEIYIFFLLKKVITIIKYCVSTDKATFDIKSVYH